MPTKDLLRSSGFLYCLRPNQLKQLILYAYLKKSKKCDTRWWLLLQHPSNITSLLGSHHFSSFLFQIKLRRFFHFKSNNIFSSFSYLKDHWNMQLTLYIPSWYLVLNANIPLYLFGKYLYLNIRIIFLIIINNNICYYQPALAIILRHSAYQLLNQQLTIHAY